MVKFISSRVVIDTNVLFEGITQKGKASGLIIDAWLAHILDVRISNALAYEYVDVLSRKLSPERWQKTQPILRELLLLAEFAPIYYLWRPSFPDPGDDHVIDCAMNVGAIIVTSNLRDFRLAEKTLGLIIMNPVEFIHYFLAT